jgi:type II secretory pathway pseudopilin PulG
MLTLPHLRTAPESGATLALKVAMKSLHSFAELLLAALILTPLLLIAGPKFSQARGAAALAQAKSDLRIYARALDAYFADHAAFPPCHLAGPGTPLDKDPSQEEPRVLERLSTPIAYMMDARLPNPFGATARISQASAAAITAAPASNSIPLEPNDPAYQSYWYQSSSATDRTLELDANGNPILPFGSPIKWIMHAPGPNQIALQLGGVLANSSGDPGVEGSRFEDCLGLVYDPTNGTDSFGVVWSAGGDLATPYGQQLFRAARASQTAGSGFQVR